MLLSRGIIEALLSSQGLSGHTARCQWSLEYASVVWRVSFRGAALLRPGVPFLVMVAATDRKSQDQDRNGSDRTSAALAEVLSCTLPTTLCDLEALLRQDA